MLNKLKPERVTFEYLKIRVILYDRWPGWYVMRRGTKIWNLILTEFPVFKKACRH